MSATPTPPSMAEIGGDLAENPPAESASLAIRRPSGAPGGLDPHELAERLRWAGPAVTNEVFEMAKRFVDDERGRQTRLDAKANSLLAVVGLSLTVAFTLGGLLIKDKTSFATGGARLVLLLGFAVALSGGIGAAVFALRSLRVKGDNPGLNENNVFRKDVWERHAEKDAAVQVAEYKKTLAMHLWKIAQKNRLLQDRKARTIHRGQIAFGVVLAGLLVVFLTLIYTAL